jgi:hypothetical protein
MTFYAVKAIKDANYDITWGQVHSRLRYLIGQAEYPQHPQLEGAASNKKRKIFA